MNQWAIAYQHLNRLLRLRYAKPASARLVIFLMTAILLTFTLADEDPIVEAFFQSPASPPAQPPPQEQPQQPPPQEEPTQQPQPPEQQPATEPVAPVSPVEEAAPTSPVAPASEPPPLPPPTPDPRANRINPETDVLEEEQEASSSNLILDQVELVDTLVVSGAYLWLCCGAILLLLIPLVFLFLQIRGQIKLRQQERL